MCDDSECGICINMHLYEYMKGWSHDYDETPSANTTPVKNLNA